MGRSALSAIAGRWQAGPVLKQDVFSTIERGRFVTPAGEVDAVVRHLDDVPWWSRPLARFLMARERRALERAGELGFTPTLLFAGDGLLVRGWIDGLPLQVAQPHGDTAYFRDARIALRRLHRRGITHNDLAKQQNWMRGRDGLAYLIDFQLASRFRRRSKLFRIAAYEDVRHLLKHKRRYAESCADRHGAPHPVSQEPAHADLDGERQARLLLDHPRRVQFRGPRRRRIAAHSGRAVDCDPAQVVSPACARRPSSHFRIAAPAPAFMPSSKPRPPCPSAS